MKSTFSSVSFLSFSIPLISAVLICSCSASAPVKREPKKAPPNVEQEFRAAEALAKSGDSKKALPRMKRFAQVNPDSNLTGNAYYSMGQMHEKAQQYPEALSDYLALINMPTASPLEIEATLRAARLQLKLSKPADAEKTLERAAYWKTASTEQLIEAEKLRYETFNAQKKNMRALEALVVLAERSPNPAEREKYKTLALESLESRFS
jgi:tetratricopeptide (TPR) repeat protein